MLRCGQAEMPVHDSQEQRWRHPDFFRHLAHITARVPRTRYPQCGVHRIEVFWARPRSGFTLPFEASALMLSRRQVLHRTEPSRLARREAP